VAQSICDGMLGSYAIKTAIFTLSNVFTAFSVSGINLVGTTDHLAQKRFIFDKNMIESSVIPITENGTDCYQRNNHGVQQPWS